MKMELESYAREISGTEAIYCYALWPEYRVRVNAKVVHNRREKTKLKKFLRIDCNILPASGLLVEPKNLEFLARWDGIQATNVSLSAKYQKYQLFFDPNFIQEVMAIVSSIPAGKTWRDDFTFVPIKQPNKFGFVGRDTAGTVARKLIEYVREYQWERVGRYGINFDSGRLE